MSIPVRLVPPDELLGAMENKDGLLADFEIEVYRKEVHIRAVRW